MYYFQWAFITQAVRFLEWQQQLKQEKKKF